MKYYVEITLLHSPEIPIHFLWEKVYRQIHIGFAEIEKDGKIEVGVSFPEYEEKWLGNKLRIFANEREKLEDFNFKKLLARLSDYIHLKSIKETPETNEYAIFKCQKIKPNNECLARRISKRKNVSYDDALESIKGRVVKKHSLPFINTQSISSGSKFPLLIERLSSKEKTESESFTSYGLSSISSVPIF